METTHAKPFVVAHRGTPNAAPENTLASFHKAWMQGADAIEGDFHLTKDGIVVCSHDADTRRVGDRSLVIKEHNYEELRKVDVGNASKFGNKFKGTPMPTLSEVLALVPQGKKIFIEIKTGPEILPALTKEVEKSGLCDEQIVIISFNKESLKEAKKQKPMWKCQWLVSLSQKSDTLEPSAEELVKAAKELKADGIDFSQNPHVDKSLIDTIHAAGLEAHCWTINDVETALRYREFGVDSITSSEAGKIKKALKQ